jgi:hypothetical protein
MCPLQVSCPKHGVDIVKWPSHHPIQVWMVKEGRLLVLSAGEMWLKAAFGLQAAIALCCQCPPLIQCIFTIVVNYLCGLYHQMLSSLSLRLSHI